MEPEYLNPSPWAEKESYEQEFNDILKQVIYKIAAFDLTISTVKVEKFFFGKFMGNKFNILLLTIDYQLDLINFYPICSFNSETV